MDSDRQTGRTQRIIDQYFAFDRPKVWICSSHRQYKHLLDRMPGCSTLYVVPNLERLYRVLTGIRRVTVFYDHYCEETWRETVAGRDLLQTVTYYNATGVFRGTSPINPPKRTTNMTTNEFPAEINPSKIPTEIIQPPRAVYTPLVGRLITAGRVVECGPSCAVTCADYSLRIKAGAGTKVFLRGETFLAGHDFSSDIWTVLGSSRFIEYSDVLVIDPREYFLCYNVDDEVYTAGCRTFDYEDAVKHWSDPDHEDPEAAAVLLKAVQDHHASLPAPVAFPNGKAWKYTAVTDAKNGTKTVMYVLEKSFDKREGFGELLWKDRAFVQQYRGKGDWEGPYSCTSFSETGVTGRMLKDTERKYGSTPDDVMLQAGFEVCS